MSVELAPRHKVGLSLRHPLLVANATAELLSLLPQGAQSPGALIAPEVGSRARRPLRVSERPGGLLRELGRGALSLSGLRALLRAAGDLPVLGRVLAAQAGPALRAAERLADEGVQGLVLDLPPGDPHPAAELVAQVLAAIDLPLIAQVPLLGALDLAEAAYQAGADALLVAGPAHGLAAFEDPHSPLPVEVHGPLLHPLYLRAVQEVARRVPLPIIARGGIHTPVDAQAFLSQGAMAVAVDSLAYVDPAAVIQIIAEI